MKKLLKWAIGIIAILVAGGTIMVFVLSESAPKTYNPEKADMVANKIMQALDKDGFDSIKYLSWNFADRQQYFWDKTNNNAIIKWDDIEVTMNLDNLDGDVIKGGSILQVNEKKEYLDQAWSHWCNDSYWLIAPYKLFDPGTTRHLAQDEGKEGLMVNYQSGGVTPGDSYLWFYDENYVPTGYKMWVKIVPIGGMYATWQDWKTLPSGAKIATAHDMDVYTLHIKGLKEGRSYTEFGYTENPFNILN